MDFKNVFQSTKSSLLIALIFSLVSSAIQFTYFRYSFLIRFIKNDVSDSQIVFSLLAPLIIFFLLAIMTFLNVRRIIKKSGYKVAAMHGSLLGIFIGLIIAVAVNIMLNYTVLSNIASIYLKSNILNFLIFPIYAITISISTWLFSRLAEEQYKRHLVSIDTGSVVQEETDKREKVWAMMSHLSLFLFAIAPLIIWKTVGKKSSFVTRQSKEALDFQISFLIYSILLLYTSFSGIPFLVILGLSGLVVINIFGTVFVITAATYSYKGYKYNYPLCLNIITRVRSEAKPSQ